MQVGNGVLKQNVLILAMAASITITGCSQSGKLINVSGHPYATEADCRRTVSLGEFDEMCDEPRLGFKNFSPPSIGFGFQSGEWHGKPDPS